MESGRSDASTGSTTRGSSSHGDAGDVFSQILGDIDTIVRELDAGVDAPKEREALKVQLAGFKDQISVLESQVRIQQSEIHSQPSLDVSLTSLQRNVDLVARSLSINPVWHSGDDKKRAGVVKRSTSCTSVSVHCGLFKRKTKKALCVSSASCKNLRAFTLRLANLHIGGLGAVIFLPFLEIITELIVDMWLCVKVKS